MSECSKSPDGKHQFGFKGVCIWCGTPKEQSQPEPQLELPSVELPPVEAPKTEEVKPGVEKLPIYTPRTPPTNRRWLDTIRNLVVQATYTISKEKGSATQDEIYDMVKAQIQEWIATEQHDKWRREWKVPRKRTVDRRVNEAADKRFAPDGIPPIAAVKAGVYCPNPELTKAHTFLKPFSEAVEKLKRWRNSRKGV